MKKKILYLLPFILYVLFYLFAIILGGGIQNLNILGVFALLTLLMGCGLGVSSNKKIHNLLGMISLFILTFSLIIMGIKNDYFEFSESKIAIYILLFYLLIFIIKKNKSLIVMNAIIISILLILFFPIKLEYRDRGTIEYKALTYRLITVNRLEEDGYYRGRELYWFPRNFN